LNIFIFEPDYLPGQAAAGGLNAATELGHGVTALTCAADARFVCDS